MVVKLEKVYMDGAVVELPGLDDVEVNDNMKPSEAAAAAAQLKAGATSSKDATVIGYVSKIATEYSEQYDNITIYMSDAKDIIGKIVDVKITDAKTWSLDGEYVE